jgi:restriction endonuclease Mrr
MGQPSSQKIAQWAIESLQSEEWISLSESCINGLKSHIPYSESDIVELVESDLDNIARILRDNAAFAVERGEVVTYEIDEEESPYIKKVCDAFPQILRDIQKMDDTKFETLCADVLKSLGWSEAERIGGIDDGGVDFYAFGFPNQEIFNLPMPPSCKVLVIGQAKRHKQDNNISENDLRKFVGGSVKKLNDFRKAGKVGVLTPVIYAFWTSSDFAESAKDYAKTMGIWFMNGRTMIEYIKKLDLDPSYFLCPP